MQQTDWQTGQITLSADGAPFDLEITIPMHAVTAQEMLPVFQKMANDFTDFGIKTSEKSDKPISCKKGCGACCSQPVPLAEIEVYHIARLVNRLQEPLQSEIRAKFEKGAAHFEAMGWFDKLAACTETNSLHKTVLEYFFEGVPCPFLEDGSCSIYEDRPIACREYLVTSPAVNCSRPFAQDIVQMPMAINASDGVRQISSGKNMPVKNFIPFINALRLAKEFPEIEIKKTGEEWLTEFFS